MSTIVNLYAVTTVEATPRDPTKGMQGYVPDWSIGQILIEKVDHGPEWVFGPADQIAVVTVETVRIGKATQASDGIVQYTRPVARLMALIQIGAKNQKVLDDTLAVFSEDVREQVIDSENAVQKFRLDELVKKYRR